MLIILSIQIQNVIQIDLNDENKQYKHLNSEYLRIEMCGHELNESWAQDIIWFNKQLNVIIKKHLYSKNLREICVQYLKNYQFVKKFLGINVNYSYCETHAAVI